MSKVTRSLRNSMIWVWLETESVVAVARECGVTVPTATHWRRIDQWDKLSERASKRAATKAVERAASRRALWIQAANRAISLMVSDLAAKTTLAWDPERFLSLVRIVEDLSRDDRDTDGQITSRAELRAVLVRFTGRDLGELLDRGPYRRGGNGSAPDLGTGDALPSDEDEPSAGLVVPPAAGADLPNAGATSGGDESGPGGVQ